jgi:DNA-binding transcriptional ArsR family regulator
VPPHLRSSPASSAEEDVVVLTDPSAIKALAHPARLVVIEALYSGQVLTATQCAALAGVSPSSMSYHLRTLAKYGIVVRAQTPGDARERPWQAAAPSLRVSVERGGRGGLAATSLLIQEALRADQEALARLTELAVETPDDEWVTSSNYARHRLMVTPAEAKDLIRRIDALLEKYHARTRKRAPAAAQPVTATVMVVPELPGRT